MRQAINAWQFPKLDPISYKTVFLCLGKSTSFYQEMICLSGKWAVQVTSLSVNVSVLQLHNAACPLAWIELGFRLLPPPPYPTPPITTGLLRDPGPCHCADACLPRPPLPPSPLRHPILFLVLVLFLIFRPVQRVVRHPQHSLLHGQCGRIGGEGQQAIPRHGACRRDARTLADQMRSSN